MGRRSGHIGTRLNFERIIHNTLLDEFYNNPNGIFVHELIKEHHSRETFYKIYFKTKSYSRWPWGFPFADIMFFDENQTHMWTKQLR